MLAADSDFLECKIKTTTMLLHFGHSEFVNYKIRLSTAPEDEWSGSAVRVEGARILRAGEAREGKKNFASRFGTTEAVP